MEGCVRDAASARKCRGAEISGAICSIFFTNPEKVPSFEATTPVFGEPPFKEELVDLASLRTHCIH